MTTYVLQVTGEHDEPLTLTQAQIDVLLDLGETHRTHLPEPSSRIFATVTTDPEEDPVSHHGTVMQKEEASALLSAGLRHVLQLALQKVPS